MNKYIVTTTINPPTEATIKFSEKPGWQLVVVGDTKTPHDDYKEINCKYISPEEQSEFHPKLSDTIGWCSIQRRNLGFIYAYHNGADVVATVDDDNIPYDSWGEDLLIGREVEVDCYASANGFFDPLSVTNHSDLWHRGYPIEMVPTRDQVEYIGKKKRICLIQADLWDGDPDIDAMSRITKTPVCKFDIERPYSSINRSPFNSQNTFLSREVLPVYAVLPHVDRMDDIWGGYLLQNYYTQNIVYNKASVFQDRNKQDLLTNLEDEIFGYRNTLKFLTSDPWSVMPKKTQEFWMAYIGSY